MGYSIYLDDEWLDCFNNTFCYALTRWLASLFSSQYPDLVQLGECRVSERPLAVEEQLVLVLRQERLADEPRGFAEDLLNWIRSKKGPAGSSCLMISDDCNPPRPRCFTVDLCDPSGEESGEFATFSPATWEKVQGWFQSLAPSNFPEVVNFATRETSTNLAELEAQLEIALPTCTDTHIREAAEEVLCILRQREDTEVSVVLHEIQRDTGLQADGE